MLPAHVSKARSGCGAGPTGRWRARATGAGPPRSSGQQHPLPSLPQHMGGDLWAPRGPTAVPRDSSPGRAPVRHSGAATRVALEAWDSTEQGDSGRTAALR